MTSSNMCVRRGCVVKVGSSSQYVENTIPNTIDIGEFNEYSLQGLLTAYNTGIVTSPNFNDPITAAIREYGEEPFYGAVAALNFHFNREDVRSFINEVDYPLLFERIETGVIFSPIEIAEFIKEFGYTPTTLSVQSAIITPKLSTELDAYYTKNFTRSTMKSFCDVLPKIFGAIGAFFTALDKIGDLINSLKNFALNFSLAGLLKQLKSKILNVIDKIVEKVKNMLNNFSIKNVLNQVSSFVSESIAAAFQKIQETAKSFFDGLNIENLKKQLEALIDYATNIFKDPKIEEIQYLLLRFCSFIASIENGIGAIITPVSNFVNSYSSARSTLVASGNANTARAVRAGAIRYDTPRREQGINTVTQTQEEYGNAPPLTAQDFEGITPWNDGNGDSRIKFIGRWPSVLGRDGWERVDQRVRAQLMQVQRDFGKQLNINSGWRSAAYNSGLRGAARNSFHLQGLALDISWSGYNSLERERFIRIAKYYGFKGIGRYGPANGNFVHIDVGPARQWTGSGGLPSDDAFRTGAAIPGPPPGQNAQAQDEANIGLDAFGDSAAGATPSTSETPLWTPAEARNVEDLRSFTPDFTGSTEGERAYARSKGYSVAPETSTTNQPAIDLSSVGSYVTYDEFGNRTIRDLSGNPITDSSDDDSSFSLSDVR